MPSSFGKDSGRERSRGAWSTLVALPSGKESQAPLEARTRESVQILIRAEHIENPNAITELHQLPPLGVELT